jgi:acyl-CoA oxidase
MAYEAAKDAMVQGSDPGFSMTPQVLALYESTCMMEDQSWYIENGIMSRRALLNRNVDAVNSMLPLLEGMINDPAVDAFVNAPMVDQDRLAAFFSSLPSFQEPESEYFRAKI